MEQVSYHPNFRMNKFVFSQAVLKKTFKRRVQKIMIRDHLLAFVPLQQLNLDPLEAIDLQRDFAYRIARHHWSADAGHLAKDLGRRLDSVGATYLRNDIFSASKIVDCLDKLRRRDLR